ncbi:VpsF family polysaccharide biosynthesis protein [Acidiphilium sp.]|uniref:VpsF family polysaccharide biosynthesis protein n=1 Tax=Acidiphilium sp. TaxID=527 RepID=UPI003CFC50EC
MTNALSRHLNPLAPRISPAYAPPPPPRLSVALAMLSLAMQLTISANLLMIMGIHYNIPGGSPIVKINPATYVAFLALTVRLFEGGDPFGALLRLFAANRLIAIFVIAFVLCIGYSLVTIGVTGSASLIDSYLSAGILMLVLCDISMAQRRVLGFIMASLYILNVTIAVGESLTRHLLIGLYVGVYQYKAPFPVFRGVALYDHPLTGAMMTSMAMFLLLQMRLRPLVTAALLGWCLVGLLAFGGRAALVATVAAMLALGAWSLIAELFHRRLTALRLLSVIGGLLLAIGIAWLVITQTSIADRLVTQDYVDSSAKVRITEWLIPKLMNFREVMLGVEVDRLPYIEYQVGLVPPFSGIENFALLAFINLGVVGFTVYLVGFLALMADLWRRSALYGRVMLVVVISVASTSNSLGAKSNILFVLAGALVAASGFASRRPARGAASPMPAPLRAPPVPSAALIPAAPPRRGLTPLAAPHRKFGLPSQR